MVDDTPTGEMLLDEALKLMKMDQSAAAQQQQMAGNGAYTNGGVGGRPQPRHTVTDWIDLMSGIHIHMCFVRY